MKIMVTGGAGFIGSHIVNEYINAGHDVVIIDDLSSGKMRFVNPKAIFYELNIHSPDVKIILEKEKISVINHHAAQISVSESVSDPLFDANSNIIGTLQLLQNAVSLKIDKFVFINCLSCFLKISCGETALIKLFSMPENSFGLHCWPGCNMNFQRISAGPTIHVL